MNRLATQYGVSGNGLAKICERLDVRYPPQGYWARKAAGKKVIQAALPAVRPGTHNAAFDREFAEMSGPLFEHKHWTCSETGIEWQKYGFGGVKLSYLLTQSGFFHDAHRALDDCHATLEIYGARASGHFDDRFVRSA